MLAARTGLLAALLTLGSCLVDDEQRCGSNQVYMASSGACVCAPGAAAGPQGCVPCGENAEPSANGCACKTGFMRGTDGVCAPSGSALGRSCTPGMTCADSTYSHCAAPGYCTRSGCTKNDDCDAGYTCATWEAAPFCKRPPTGLNKPCASAADCAGMDANFCEGFVTRSCQVAGCTVSPDNCHAGATCCDLSKVGVPATLCLPKGACP